MGLSKDGEQIIFPVQRQQRFVDTAGWGNHTGLLVSGLSEVFCAVWERYKAVDQPIPVFTVTVDAVTKSTDQSEESYLELLEWLSNVGVPEYWSQLLQQLHSAVRELKDHYVTENNDEIDDEYLDSLGLKESGAIYPDDIQGLKNALLRLTYTRSDPYELSHSFNFTEWNLSDGGYTDGFVYAPYVLPRTDEFGRDTGSWRTKESSSIRGESKLGVYQSLHRLFSHYLTERRKVCPRFFYAPCNGFQKVVSSREGSTVGDLPLGPVTIDDVNPITEETEYTFEFDNVLPFYNYFLTGSCSVNELRSDQRGKYAVRANCIFLNDCLIPQFPQHPWEVTSLLKCGTNKIRIVYYGDYRWTSIYLVPMVPVNPALGYASGFNTFALNEQCWEKVKYAYWIYPDCKSPETVDFSLDFAKIAEDPEEPFKCVVDGQAGIKFNQPPTVDGVPKAPRSRQVVRAEFTAPNEAETYRADLVYYPLTLDRRSALTDPHTLAEGPVERVDILETGTVGPLGGVNSFTFETPCDVVWEWIIRITFDTGDMIEGVLPNQGVFFGDGEKRYVSGGLEYGTTGMCFNPPDKTSPYPSCSLEPVFL